ncbi:MAG: hypothetical protein ABJA81_02545 [Nocardioidaceae bacterium]
MLVGEARAAAVDWVQRIGALVPEFRGAFFTGSVTSLPLEAPLPATSDVDIAVVTAGSTVPPKLGKFVHGGVLLEVTYVPWSQLENIDDVARTYYLAPSFSSDQIIGDPTGHLGRVRDQIAPTFAEPQAIRRRRSNAVDKLKRGLEAIDPGGPWHEQVTAWMFPTSITTHVVLIAALRNPTVRLRYLAARDVLYEHGREALYHDLLALLGCAGLEPDVVQGHLDRLSTTFDQATSVASTPLFFSADITAPARHIAIDGSQTLIDRGDYREAVFWIVATFARCQRILAADASASVFRDSDVLFRAAVADLLGVRDTNELLRRRRAVLNFLPTLQSLDDLPLDDLRG